MLETLTVKRVSPGPKGRLVIWFDGISNRSEADAHKGAWLAIAADALGDLADDEFWYHEVAGWRVCTRDNELLGKVVRIVDGATELLEVRPPKGGETYFIPMVDAFIVDFDREEGRVIVDPIEGLIP